MMPEDKAETLSSNLEKFRSEEQCRQGDLNNLLQEYSQLLDDYKVLRKAFDVNPTSSVVALGAQHSAGAVQIQDGYVLVLVDGNDYIFRDELIQEKEEGGIRAARLFNDAVEKHIYQHIPDARTARIVVRIYADFTTLSKHLAKAKLAGIEKRSIAPFSAGFTRSLGFFDFVDALDGEGTRFKIRAGLKHAAEDESCSHVLFAACHHPAYLSQLEPFHGMRKKVTLVQGAAWNPEFEKFNLSITQFATVFRRSELPTPAPTTRPSASAIGSTPYKGITVTTRPTLRTSSWRRDGPAKDRHSALSSPELVPVRTSSSSNGLNPSTESVISQE